MNIKTRIERIEKAIQPNGGLCDCANVNKYEMWIADLGAESNTTAPHLDSAPVPDICAICRRPIGKRKLILQLCDQTTKDRFPAEWNAKKEN